MSESKKLNGYELSRTWFDFCFENPELIKPVHSAVYFFAIEHCNRLGWKKKFGFPSAMTMDALGIKSYNTYITALNDLVKFGFIEMIQKSRNQYSANIIALSKYDKALYKALDKAFIKHGSKQSESTIQSTVQSIGSIVKQENKEQENNATIAECEFELGVEDVEITFLSFDDFWNMYDLKKDNKKCKDKYSKISESDRSLIKANLPLYVESTTTSRNSNNMTFRKNPLTWINGECWNDDVSAKDPLLEFDHTRMSR